MAFASVGEKSGPMPGVGHDSEGAYHGEREINETGHVQEMERNFSLFSICSVGIVTGNTWAALGGSIAIAIYNGGPAGVIYEFILVSIFYFFVAASIAELSSSMPSSSGVYQWASLTPGPKYGRVVGWFAGYWNTFAWVCASATTGNISANIVISLYGLYHPDYVFQRWHTFVGFIVAIWLCCGTVMFFNKALPMINNIGMVFILGGVISTIVVCAVMPGQTGTGYASSRSVWADWNNQSGYSSDGFVFLAGMLNGAYAIGVPDCVTHLAEEIPNPKRNVPWAIAAQMGIGFVTAFAYMVAMFYAISNLSNVLDAPIFPLTEIYLQATNSRGGAVGLSIIILLPFLCTSIGTFITSGRCLWALARDDAIPFSSTLGIVSPRWKNPFNATLACGIFSTILGAIYVGSATAFNAFVGSFAVLTTLSYMAAILPFVFTRRFSRASEEPGLYKNNMKPGPFQMGHMTGYSVNIISCLYIVVFVVIFCFPPVLPVSAANMNYTCVIVGGISIFAGVWWLVKGKTYIGPQILVIPIQHGTEVVS